jgi:hypothetical protein
VYFQINYKIFDRYGMCYPEQKVNSPTCEQSQSVPSATPYFDPFLDESPHIEKWTNSQNQHVLEQWDAEVIKRTSNFLSGNITESYK